MANAHLPNSHPDVTPDWIEPRNKFVTFASALQTKLAVGSNNVYEGFVPNDWCNPAPTGWVAHGGYICALIITTSRKYFEAKHSERKQPDPIHTHVQYLNPLPAGPIKITITDLQLGSKHSVIQVVFSSSKDSLSAASAVIALVTHGNLSHSPQARSQSINIEMEREKLPSRETECMRWSDAQFFKINPTSIRYRSYPVKGGPNPMWSPAVGRNKRDIWLKPDEVGKKMGMAHLGLIVDLIPPIPFNYEKDALESTLKWAFPTICLSLDIKRDPEGEEWLLQRVVMNDCENGRMELDVKIIDEKGRVVAVAKHAALVLPRMGTEPIHHGRKGAVL